MNILIAGRSFALLLCMVSAACGGPQQSSVAPPVQPPATIAVRGEARVFIGTEPVATLNAISKVTAVYTYDDKGARVDYQQGSDWTVSGGKIARTAGSQIPDFAKYRYTPSEGVRFAFASEPRNPPLTINYNVYIDYMTTASDRLVKAVPLPRPTRSVLCIGDSIAQGAHTIASFYFKTDAQSWCGLLRTRLQGKAAVSNLAVPGATLESLSKDIDTYLASPVDTVILAFGMNDHIYGADYLPTFTKLLDEVLSRLAAKGSNVLLVGFFQQNSLWLLEDRAQTSAYNEAIRTAARARGVPFIDPYAAFEKALPEGEGAGLSAFLSVALQYSTGYNPFTVPGGTPASEPAYHLTADFMHHPNLYGQRIYYSLMVPYFLEADTMASSIDGYVLNDW